MAFLTIGAVTVSVSTSNARLSEPIQIGARRRAFSGMLLSSVKAEKRVWDVETIPEPDATIAALDAVIALYQSVSVTGDLTQNVATNCRVRKTGETFVPDGLLSLRKASYEISEI